MAAAAALEKRGFKDLQVSCYGVAVGCCSSVAAVLRLLMSFIWRRLLLSKRGDLRICR